MATINDVINLVNTYYRGVRSMRDSESVDETKSIIQELINATEAMQSPGNSLNYLADIDDALVDLMLDLGTSQTSVDMEALENAWERYFNYLRGHWWQFGADETRVALFELPNAPTFT